MVAVKKFASKFRGKQSVAFKTFQRRYKTSAFPEVKSALEHQEKINRHIDEEITSFISHYRPAFPKGIFQGNPIKRQRAIIQANGEYTEITRTVYFRTVLFDPEAKKLIFESAIRPGK